MINGYFETIIVLILVNVVFTLSLNLILGYNGQFSLGHAAFLAIGAYTSAIVVGAFGLPLLAGIMLGGIVSILLGLVTGVPALRLRGDYLAIATLGFAEIVMRVLLILPPEYFGGATGIPGGASKIAALPQLGNILRIPGVVKPEHLGKAIGELTGAAPHNLNQFMNALFSVLWIAVFGCLLGYGIYVFGNVLAKAAYRRIGKAMWPGIAAKAVYYATILAFVTFRWQKLNRLFYKIFELQKTRSWESYLSSQWTVFLFLILTAVIVTWLIRNYLNSTYGRAVVAIREDEIASTMLGINLFRFKLLNFLIGAFFAGFAGGLFAHAIPSFNPYEFNLFKSVEVLLMVVLGGMGSLTGSFLGATAITILPEALRAVGQWRMVLYSLVLVFLMIFRPGGFFGQGEIVIKVPAFLRRRDVPKGGSVGA